MARLISIPRRFLARRWLRRLLLTATGLGGVDEIIVGDGADYVIAGVGDDKVNVCRVTGTRTDW